jgi:hypothetical protein
MSGRGFMAGGWRGMSGRGFMAGGWRGMSGRGFMAGGWRGCIVGTGLTIAGGQPCAGVGGHGTGTV